MYRLPAYTLILILYLSPGCAAALAGSAAAEENVSATIKYLLWYVEKSDCIFIRNNKEHTAKEAVRHMRAKYAHFRDDIETPEDFIRLSASRSLISGKPYMVKTKAGKLMKSETWLLEALDAYRQKRHLKEVEAAQ